MKRYFKNYVYNLDNVTEVQQNDIKAAFQNLLKKL